jgi:hypothetical protein
MKTRKKRSPIWQPTREEFQNICKMYTTLADVIRHFGMKPPANYNTLEGRIKIENIDISHITLGLGTNRIRKGTSYRGSTGTNLDEILVENSSFTNLGSIKRKLFKSGKWKEYKCAICGINEWQGQPLVLRLDHINGVPNDHRLENLRLVCPNCDSQLPTFCKGSKKLPSSARGLGRVPLKDKIEGSSPSEGTVSGHEYSKLVHINP